MSDYELVYMAQENIEEAKDALYKKYRALLFSQILKFYQKNKYTKIDIEDIKLECLIVFEHVIDSYNQDKDSKFSTYLLLCLNSKLKDILRTVNSKKNFHNNKALSYYEDLNGIKLSDMLYNNKDLTEKKVIEDYIGIEQIINIVKNDLSDFEIRVLKLLIKGYTHEQISKKLNTNIKKVYNAVYRIKNKFKKIK